MEDDDDDKHRMAAQNQNMDAYAAAEGEKDLEKQTEDIPKQGDDVDMGGDPILIEPDAQAATQMPAEPGDEPMHSEHVDEQMADEDMPGKLLID